MIKNALSRRKFLKASGISGTALLLGFYFKGIAKTPTIINAGDAVGSNVELKSWIIINTNGKVTLVSHRAEMGQGVYQAIAQIIAEELEVNLQEVDIVFAQGNQNKFGSQITGGSSTISGSYKNLLQLSASARQMLVTAAAAKWNVATNDCYAKDGHVYHHPTGKKYHYGELVAAAAKLEPPKDVILKKRSDYKLIGKPMPRQDTPMKTNGTAVFGLDKRLPGMLYASVERNPRLRGTIKSYNDTAALKIPGVKKVVKIKMKVFETFREGVAVIADNTWAALQGRKALKIEWNDAGFEHLDTETIYERQRNALQTKQGIVFKEQGEADKMLAKADSKIDVVYQTPYQSHSAMEPLNCIADYKGDSIEVWGPIQAPDWVQGHLSKELNLPMEKVTINMTFLGGGFGRKAFLDYPYEAAMLSKTLGAPVMITWTREDDMNQGPFRPGISYRCQAGISNGKIDAMKVTLAGQNINHWMGADKAKPNDSATEGFVAHYFDSIKNISVRDVPFETPIPIMWWRSVYASTNGFAYESLIDEIAVAATKDPLQLRREYLHESRMQLLIDRLEEVSGWKNRQQQEGFGVAITECFGSTVGQVVKVSKKEGGGVKIDKVWAVVDCGWYVNPDIIKAQVEGSVVMAIGAATVHEITFNDGKAMQQNFYNYPMPRINNVPPIEVFIMENDADAGGVGEPGLPALAPALTNAIFNLTGKRIRTLPFDLDKV